MTHIKSHLLDNDGGFIAECTAQTLGGGLMRLTFNDKTPDVRLPDGRPPDGGLSSGGSPPAVLPPEVAYPSPGTRVKIKVNGGEYGILLYSGVTESVFGGGIMVSGTKILEQIQRRQDFKFVINMPCVLLISAMPESGGRPGRRASNAKVLVRDISAGGICFISGEFIEPETEHELIYNDRAYGYSELFRFKILRRSLFEEDLPVFGDYELTGAESGTVYSYGCKFTDLNDETERKIRSYVYKLSGNNR